MFSVKLTSIFIYLLRTINSKKLRKSGRFSTKNNFITSVKVPFTAYIENIRHCSCHQNTQFEKYKNNWRHCFRVCVEFLTFHVIHQAILFSFLFGCISHFNYLLIHSTCEVNVNPFILIKYRHFEYRFLHLMSSQRSNLLKPKNWLFNQLFSSHR